MLNQSDSEPLISKTCKVCGERLYTQIEVLGKTRALPIPCFCQREEMEKRYEKEEAEEKQRRLDRLKIYSMMDAHFEKCRFENWDTNLVSKSYYTMAKNYVDQWADIKARNVGLLLWGKPGCGKSYMSFCIANALIEKFVPVIAISSIGILNRIKDTFDKHGQEGQTEIIRGLEDASLLVLDDLGAEAKTRWANETIYSIIDARYRSSKPIIITTNLSPEQLREKTISDDGVARIYDRIIEMCTPVEISGNSIRRLVAKQKGEFIKELFSR